MGAKKDIPVLIWLHPSSETQLLIKPPMAPLSSQQGPRAMTGCVDLCIGAWHCSPRLRGAGCQ